MRRLAHLSDLHFGRVDPAAADPIVPAGNAARLAAMLTEAGAVVRHETVPAGHGLSQADLAITKDWFGRLQ